MQGKWGGRWSGPQANPEPKTSCSRGNPIPTHTTGGSRKHGTSVFLEAAGPYELGEPPQFQLGTLYPAYIRGQAQLMARNGTAAAAEFQKFLNHRGIVVNFPLGALAHLGLARAYALSGDTA